MKLISLALSAILCTTGVQAQEETHLQPKLGQEAIAQIRKGYEGGTYNEFLREMDDSYQAVVGQNGLDSFANLRGGKEDHSEWEEGARQIQYATDTALLEAVKNEDSFFSEQVRSAAQQIVTPDQEKALSHFRTLHQMGPGSGKNDDENRLIDLDIEYEYKALHLNRPATQGESIQDLQEKRFVLCMEKLDKMLTSAALFTDETLKGDMQLFQQNFDGRLAKNWDRSNVRSFVKNTPHPTDLVQQQVIEIYQLHQEQLGDLTRQYVVEK